MTLKELRKSKNLTQAACAEYLNMTLRTYQNYENDKKKTKTMKYAFIMQKLGKYGFIDETHGVLSIEQIKNICSTVFQNLDIE